MTRKRDELLDHEADGIREFDNDLPRWWLYGFYFTIVFAILYLVNYLVLPQPIIGKKTLAEEYAAEMAAARAAGATGTTTAAATGMAAPGGPAAVALAPLTDSDSLARGKAIFESQTNPCQACHRPDLGGLVGPNLTDEYWLHGCTVADLTHTIKAGYPERGMLPSGGGPALDDAQLLDVASYILSMQGSHPPNPKPRDPARAVECGAGGHENEHDSDTH